MAKRVKITYATISADNEELQADLDEAIAKVRAEWLGREVPIFIDGKQVYCADKRETVSPIDRSIRLCTAQHGSTEDVDRAVAAAKRVLPAWEETPWQERVALLRRIAETISDNSLMLSALMVFEVGKSRLEALGEVEETADLLRYYADSMQKNHGFVNELGKLRPDDPTERNFSVLRPYGVWAVISPFNFPMALAAAPIAAALVCGNTVVFKNASATSFVGWKTAELFAEARSAPPGVFNFVSGPGRTVGQRLQDHPDICGWTFTGSYAVGMQLARNAVGGPYPRRAIIEMGGKNPTIVSATADLDKATTGVMRAAFGMDGQKCSACSRVYVHRDRYDDFLARLVEKSSRLEVGDPTDRQTFMGTVIDATAYADYQRFVAQAGRYGHIEFGGHVLTQGKLANGYYVEPTIVTGLDEAHPLVREELFLPILHVAKVDDLDEAMAKANDTQYGLTAGFFGEDDEEVKWFLRNIQAGTTYTNRAAGATTGAWPGVQVFGGWKGSGSSGKGIGGLYTLALYMHEQSRTIIG